MSPRLSNDLGLIAVLEAPQPAPSTSEDVATNTVSQPTTLAVGPEDAGPRSS